MANTLGDIVEPQNIRTPEAIPSDYEDKTIGYDPTIDPSGFISSVIDFRYLGIKYKASDLWGYGLDSTCSTCSNHYTVVFVDKGISETSYVVQDGYDYIFVLPVDNTIVDGHQFCKYIVDELNRSENAAFIDHFQQYAYKDECLYVYDNRNKELGSFYTSIHVIPIGLKAEYNGPDIKLYTDYNKSDVKVKLIHSDRSIKILTDSEWTASSLTVSVLGPNKFIATYNENHYLTAEYIVNGYWIEKIEAKYTGPDVPVQEYYDTHDVKVKAIFVDGSFEILNWNQLTWEEDLRISDNGLLRKFVSYTDEFGHDFTADYFVPGIPRPINLKAKYFGIKKPSGTPIQKEEVKVYVTYLLNDFDEDHRQAEDVRLNAEDWSFIDTNIVTDENEGSLIVRWAPTISFVQFYFVTSIQVELIDGTDCYLIAWYEGPDIEVGEAYDLRHVILYLCEPGHDRIQLHYLDEGVIMDRDMIIKAEGENEYEAIYIYDRWVLRTKYYVPGVISKQYPDIGFKVIYIEKDTFEETDLTEDFLPYFTYKNAFTISWNQFMLRIRDYVEEGNPYFGMFRVDAPKRTGLWNKYASSWHVYVFNTRNLKAEIYKVYCDPIPIEEDKNHGATKKDIPNSNN